MRLIAEGLKDRLTGGRANMTASLIDTAQTPSLALRMDSSPLPLPAVRIRGRSFMALIVVPEAPLEAWFAALDEQLRRATGFFTDRPVIANLSAVQDDETANLPALLDALQERGMRLVAVEGTDAARLAGSSWAHLANLRQRLEDSRQTAEGRALAIPDDPPESAPEPPPEPPALPSLIVDRPVRSGQAVIHEHGDVVIIGAVASGAEIIAGGSIHVYGALRGRAIAGLKTGEAARIFCRKLNAEMLCIDGVFETAEQWSEALNGRAVQIQLAHGALQFSTLD